MLASLLLFVPFFAYGYDVETSIHSAQYAELTFCMPDLLESWDCILCKQMPPPSNFTAVRGSTYKSRGFVAVFPKETIQVSFRGSTPLKNWIEDLKVWKKRSPWPACQKCEVHSGFLATWEEIRQGVLEAVHAAHVENPSLPIRVSGHSEGAAVSVLCGLDIVESGMPLDAIYTYGQPRLGNPEMADYINSALPDRLWRVVHWKDIVPQLPPEVLGFKQTAHEVWYNEANTAFKVCDGSGVDPACKPAGLPIPDNHHHYMGYNFTGGEAYC